MKVHQQQAHVLHRWPYTESSLLVDVFSRDYGRLTLVAKGARRLNSPLRGLINPFKPLVMSWSGKGQLPILTMIENGPYVQDLNRQSLSCGYYMNELIIQFLQRYDPHEELYQCYAQTLLELTENADVHMPLRLFEKQLLKEVGFGIVLDHDVETGEPIQPQNDYFYFPDRGPSQAHIKDERFLRISGATLTRFHRDDLSEKSTQSEARKLTRVLIDYQLRGKEMRSRNIMQAIKKYAP